jgi:hypothetical protein
MRSFATIQLYVAIAIASVAGCAASPPSESGTLQIPLVVNDGAGTVYRLSAQFTVSGPAGTLTVDANVDTPTVSLALQPGDYTVTLLDDWHLEKSVNGQPFQPIAAQLGSPNPAQVTIAPGGMATTAFFFLIPQGNHGNLTIAFGVIPLHARLFVTLHTTFASDGLAGYLEHPASLVISYSVDAEGVHNIPPLLHEVLSLTTDMRFTDDPVGVLSAAGPATGGSLEYEIEVQPDGSQVLVLSYGVRRGAALLFLFASAIPFVPKVPVDELGVPADPGRVGHRATTDFTLTAGVDTMSGTVELQFSPES